MSTDSEEEYGTFVALWCKQLKLIKHLNICVSTIASCSYTVVGCCLSFKSEHGQEPSWCVCVWKNLSRRRTIHLVVTLNSKKGIVILTSGLLYEFQTSQARAKLVCVCVCVSGGSSSGMRKTHLAMHE